MESMIRFLFSSNLSFPGSWEEEISLEKLSETVQQLCSNLRSIQPELWTEYQKQLDALRDQERWIEFERGFLSAMQLMTESMQKISKS